MNNLEPLIASELEQMLPLPDGRRADWIDVLRRAGLEGAGHVWHRGLAPTRRSRWRSVLVVAVVVAALVGVGVAIAAGFGAFNGISAAERPQTPADKLDPALLALINYADTVRGPGGQLLPDSSRLVRQLSNGTRIYAVATKDGQLCVLAEGLADSNTGKGGGNGMGCGSPLTQSQPTTLASFKAYRGTSAINWGITLDHINAVSFELAGQDVTVPVRNNVWAYQGPSPLNARSVTLHYDDGTTVPFNP